MKVAITGANGYLASLVQKYNQGKLEFIPITRKECNMDDPEKVRAFFETLDFDIVFHTAADAVTAHCEAMPEMTHRINTESPMAIADVCKARGKRMIFIGTEQSFNGKTTPGPFTEEDEMVSVTNYGLQKKETDLYIQAHLDNYLIVRFSWMMGMAEPGVRPSANIMKNVLNAILHEQPTLFTVNEVRGMTYAKRFADQFVDFIQLESGVYHFSNVNTRNTYESAKYVARQIGASEETIDKYILPNTERYQDRFRDYRLDASKIKAKGIQLGTFEEDVDLCLRDYGWK